MDKQCWYLLPESKHRVPKSQALSMICDSAWRVRKVEITGWKAERMLEDMVKKGIVQLVPAGVEE